MKKEFYYNSQDGATQIHAIEWIPDVPVAGVLQICHGMAEYIDRYDEFAEYMSAQGFYVVGNDHLGHGKSVRSEKYLGHFQEYNGNGYVIEDIRTLQEQSLERYPGVPYIMMGHSMGSFLLRQYLTIYGEDVSAAIIMGTGDQPAMMLTVAKLLCKMMASFKGWRYKSKFMDNMVLGSYNKKFQPEKTGVEWLSVNEENCVRYVADPLCGFSFTLGGYNQMFEGMSQLTKKENLANMPKDIPVLFISGAEDPVGGFGKGVKKVFQDFRGLGMQDVTIRLYAGDRHEILKEDNREKVMDDILSWVFGSRENLADEKFPANKALEFRAVTLKEKGVHKATPTSQVIAELEEAQKKADKRVVKKVEPKKPAPVKPVVKNPIETKPLVKQPEMKWPEVKPSDRKISLDQPLTAARVKPLEEEAVVEPVVPEKEPLYKFTPVTMVDFGAVQGLTPLSSVDEDGKTESDIIAERLASIMQGTYVFEDERLAEEEAARAAAEEEARIAAAAETARQLEEAARKAEEAELAKEMAAIDKTGDEETEDLDALLDAVEEDPLLVLPVREPEAKPESVVKAEPVVKESVEEEKQEEVTYLSEEDELLAFIEKLEAEKIVKGEPLAVYEPEEVDPFEADEKKPGPVLKDLVLNKPNSEDFNEYGHETDMEVDFVDLSSVGDVFEEMTGVQAADDDDDFDELAEELETLPEDVSEEVTEEAEIEKEEMKEAEITETEITEEVKEPEEAAVEELPVEEPEEIAAEEPEQVYADSEEYLMDLSAMIADMDDIESEDEEDFGETEELPIEELKAQDFSEDFEEEDFEEADLEEADFEEEEEIPVEAKEEEDFDEEDFEEADLEEADFEEEFDEDEGFEDYDLKPLFAEMKGDDFDFEVNFEDTAKSSDEDDDVKAYIGDSLDKIKEEFDAEAVDAEPTINLNMIEL